MRDAPFLRILVRRAGPGSDDKHAGLPACPGIPRGHEPGALLARWNDEVEARATLRVLFQVVTKDVIVGGKNSAPAVTKNGVDTQFGEDLSSAARHN